MTKPVWFDSINETFDSSPLLITDTGPPALMHQRHPLKLKGQVFPAHIFALRTIVWIFNGLKWCVFGVETNLFYCLSLQALFWGAFFKGSFSGSSLSWLSVLCSDGSRGDHSRVRGWKCPRTHSRQRFQHGIVSTNVNTTKNVISSCRFCSRFVFCLLWILLNSCCKYSKHDPFIFNRVKHSSVVY